jgi:hypothetical protein
MDPDVLWRLDLMVGSRAVVQTQLLTFTYFSLLIPLGPTKWHGVRISQRKKSATSLFSTQLR